ncbi:MAG: hypothetical protein K6D02_06070 [Lachnospiraceae bacterium]|nr:hypothetical protein [Lachnospiraceae bacterium]
MDTNIDLRKRLLELADKAYSENRFIFTDFLNVAQMSEFYQMEREFNYVGATAFGGSKDNERCMVRFGSPEILGYEESFPIAILRVVPVAKKFADKLTHRDFLGSVLGLGLEREKIGDIFINENEGYIFADEAISEYIIDNLSKVKHTVVKVSLANKVPEVFFTLKEEVLTVSSNRIDAIIARLYNLSRESALKYFVEGKVFINGINTTENAKKLKDKDIVSVRGFGKFIFEKELGETKKGRLRVSVSKYV